MKKLTGLLAIGCSLALAGSLLAQAPEAQESPSKGKETATEKTPRGAGQRKSTLQEQGTSETGGGAKQHATRGERGANSENANAATSPGETNAAEQETGGKKGRHGHHANAAADQTTATESPGATQGEQGRKGRHGRNANVTGAEPSATASAGANEQAGKGRHGRGKNAVNAQTSPSASPAGTAAANTSPVTSPAAGTSPSPAASAGATTNTNAGATNVAAGQGTVGRGGKRVEPQQVQQIKQQHASFHAQPKPDRAPAVAFNPNYRIQGADRWQGPQYEVFRAYHPERHDRNWYHSHFARVELIGGGYYYWNNGYWYPAWGYDPSAQYYAYDGPIYVGHSAEPPDQVIADVQAELQAMGYYTGEVDGLLGPLTRQALADYQADHGLTQTAAIDEPTLDALQLS